jgi:hypothetical protein
MLRYVVVAALLSACGGMQPNDAAADSGTRDVVDSARGDSADATAAEDVETLEDVRAVDARVDAAPDVRVDSGPACNGTRPAPGTQTCAMTGCAVADFSLGHCNALGSTYSFYGDGFCDATATVLVIGASGTRSGGGAGVVQMQVASQFASRGVRMVVAYARASGTRTPTATDAPECVSWGTTSMITSDLLLDTTQTTVAYDPVNVSAVVVVDQHGMIRDVVQGLDYATYDATRVSSVLNAILASQGR